LLAPTHRTAPANQRDRIVVKNLLDEGIARLEGEFAKREVAPVVKNLTKLVDKVDWDHALDGLALFASKGIAQAVQLPFRVKARFVVDAVDELIEKTLADGGEVFFYDDGALDLHQRIAAVLRY
jgi:hypothetical protein